MKTVPFFEYSKIFRDNKDKLLEIFSDVGSRGAYILQNDLNKFEVSLSKYTGAKYAIGVNNATDALQIGLINGGIKSGDEVIISSHTMVATAGAIHHVGGVPVPVEVGNDLLIDYQSIESNITSKTKAIMPTHLNGRTCNMDMIMKIATKHNLLIFEDAAQALGSKFKGKSAGTFGVSSAISFYPAKNLGALGDAGAILTNDENLYEQMISYRDHGRFNKTGEVINWGVNSRLDNLQAAFLNFFLSKYEQTVLRRRFIAKMYQELLEEISQIKLPQPPNNGDHYDVFQNYEIRAKDRDQLKIFLEEKGVGTLVQWSGKAIHHYKLLGFNIDLPKTDKIFDEIIMLPLNLFISDDDVEYVAECIKEFYGY